MKNYKYSVGVWAFGGCSDRFCESGYQEKRNFAQKIEAASKVKGLNGVEIHYNGDFTEKNVVEVKKIIDNSGLEVSAVDCEIFGDKVFSKGALSSTNIDVRKKAIEIVEHAADMASYLGASLVNVWPGADGSDYSFQLDYVKQWNLLIDSIKTFTANKKEAKFSLEYKIREPRIRSIIGSASTALTIINEIKADNLGVTIDFGHSLMSKENPAQAASMINNYGRLFHTHLNDNSRDWDDDLIVNTYHMWETLEFLYYLKKLNYTGWLGLDMSPARENQIEGVEYSINTIEKMLTYVDEYDTDELANALLNTDALSAQKYIANKIFK